MIIETLSYGIQYRLTKKILLSFVLGDCCRAGEGGPHPGSREDGAPLLLVVGCRPADAWVRRYDGKNGAEVDASIVATYLMLAAENEGLATLWVGSFDPALLKGILPGTDGYELVAMINVGYEADGSMPSDMHGRRIPLEGFVTNC